MELPGVHKKDIEFEAMENGFCLTAPRDDIEYRGCWVLMLKADPKKATATFSNGLFKAIIPLAERVASVEGTHKIDHPFVEALLSTRWYHPYVMHVGLARCLYL